MFKNMQGIQGAMKKAQEMQKKMETISQELTELETFGSSGGGAIKAILHGEKLTSIAVDPTLYAEESQDIIQDLIVAAVNDAIYKRKQIADARMQEVSLHIPPELSFLR